MFALSVLITHKYVGGSSTVLFFGRMYLVEIDLRCCIHVNVVIFLDGISHSTSTLFIVST